MKKDSKFEIIKQELCAQLQEVTVGRRPEMRERRDIGVYKHLKRRNLRINGKIAEKGESFFA